MGSRIRRDLHKRVGSSGYQQLTGNMRVDGTISGSTISGINAALAKLGAVSTIPVKLSAPTAEGRMRSILLRWTKQYNLANFSHYELQVSEDDKTWFSLLLDGTGWKGDINETTTVRVEMFEHANIPLIENAGDLSGKTLYYRVRQVTLSEAYSEWSDSASAITLGVEDVVLTDSQHRYIEISSRKGIYADDRQGHVIHDIPDAPILTGTVYGGHVLMLDATNYLDSIDLGDTSTATSYSASSAVTNTTLAEHLPVGLTNVKAAVIRFQGIIYIGSSKIDVETAYLGNTRYCTRFNTDTSGYNTISSYSNKAYVADVGIEMGWIAQAIVPITYDGSVPYITWVSYFYMTGMLNPNDMYSYSARIFLQGVLV